MSLGQELLYFLRSAAGWKVAFVERDYFALLSLHTFVHVTLYSTLESLFFFPTQRWGQS